MGRARPRCPSPASAGRGRRRRDLRVGRVRRHRRRQAQLVEPLRRRLCQDDGTHSPRRPERTRSPVRPGRAPDEGRVGRTTGDSRGGEQEAHRRGGRPSPRWAPDRPLEGATDKTTGESSFARTIVHLRARLHRGAPGTARERDRLDGAAVALCAPTDVALQGSLIRRGVVRCGNAFVDPPRRGRPKVASTLTLDEVVHLWVRVYLEGVGAAAPDWAEPEAEP